MANPPERFTSADLALAAVGIVYSDIGTSPLYALRDAFTLRTDGFLVFTANALKIPHGGWLTLAFGTSLFLLMTTWNGGRRLIAKHLWSKMPQLTAPTCKRYSCSRRREFGVRLFI